MKSNLTMEEVQSDLRDSQRDVASLRMLVSGMRVFVNQPGAENRSHLRLDLLKWETMLSTGEMLHAKIEEALASISTP